MAYDMLTVRRSRLNVVNLEAITTYSGSLFHRAITRTGKEFARTLITFIRDTLQYKRVLIASDLVPSLVLWFR